jgi:hypothetical protein
MQLKRTWNLALLAALVFGTLAGGMARTVPVAGQEDADAQARIVDAMGAAPSTVSANATILDTEVDDTGEFIVLREGSNGWTCFPDGPGTPSVDPMCLDPTWMNWLRAYIAGEEPNTTVVGLAYMLQGGSESSNTDPFATEPAAGEEWMISPPHVMLVVPGEIDQTVFSADFHSGAPWIMWAGTPYAHIMMPVAEGVMGEMSGMAATPPA